MGFKKRRRWKPAIMFYRLVRTARGHACHWIILLIDRDGKTLRNLPHMAWEMGQAQCVGMP